MDFLNYSCLSHLLLNSKRILNSLLKDKIADDTIPEVGTVTLTNTAKFPFTNSQKTVSLTKKRNNMDYAFEVISAVSSDAKPIGDITISNRQLNGFALAYSGSAASVTIKYRITGGIRA